MWYENVVENEGKNNLLSVNQKDAFKAKYFKTL